MNKTNISYLTFTWNPTHGCSKISAGCKNCWAEKMSKRLAGIGVDGYWKEKPFEPRFCEWIADEPLHIKKPSVIGVSFMGDLFHDFISFENIMDIFDIFYKCPQHTFVLCTKRPGNVVNMFRAFEDYDDPKILSNIWFGCSIENKKTFDERMPHMLSLKADYHLNTWVSAEPLLEDISDSIIMHGGYNDIIDCTIVGGESGTGARYCNPDWITKIINLYPEKAYWKQWGTNKTNFDNKLYNQNDNIIKSVERVKNLPWLITKNK